MAACGEGKPAPTTHFDSYPAAKAKVTALAKAEDKKPLFADASEEKRAEIKSDLRGAVVLFKKHTLEETQRLIDASDATKKYVDAESGKTYDVLEYTDDEGSKRLVISSAEENDFEEMSTDLRVTVDKDGEVSIDYSHYEHLKSNGGTTDIDSLDVEQNHVQAFGSFDFDGVRNSGNDEGSRLVRFTSNFGPYDAQYGESSDLGFIVDGMARVDQFMSDFDKVRQAPNNAN